MFSKITSKLYVWPDNIANMFMRTIGGPKSQSLKSVSASTSTAKFLGHKLATKVVMVIEFHSEEPIVLLNVTTSSATRDNYQLQLDFLVVAMRAHAPH